MAILVIFTGEGFTKEMYEKLRPEVNWEKDNPAGGIFHVASFDEDGNLHVADVWDSAEEMDEFVKNRLAPAMQKFNIPMPKVEVFPAHNINAYKAIEKYIL